MTPLSLQGKLSRLIDKHYGRGRLKRSLGRPVAWAGSHVPHELLAAMGFAVYLPETHAAICGVRGSGGRLAEHTERSGYHPSLCGAARADLGTIIGGESPLVGLPEPSIVVASSGSCTTVVKWLTESARLFDVPLFVWDVPMTRVPEAHLREDYVHDQLAELLEGITEATGKDLKTGKLHKAVTSAAHAATIWGQVLDAARLDAAPVTSMDLWMLSWPLVAMRWLPKAGGYFDALAREVDRRREHPPRGSTTAGPKLVWDGPPPWIAYGAIAKALEARGARIVADTYNDDWRPLAAMGSDDLVRSVVDAHRARARGMLVEERLARLEEAIEATGAQGVIAFQAATCLPYSLGQRALLDSLESRYRIPSLLLRGDVVDGRSHPPEALAGAVGAFVDGLPRRL